MASWSSPTSFINFLPFPSGEMRFLYAFWISLSWTISCLLNWLYRHFWKSWWDTAAWNGIPLMRSTIVLYLFLWQGFSIVCQFFQLECHAFLSEVRVTCVGRLCVMRYRSLTRQPISVWNINISLCFASCGVADRSALIILSFSSSVM